MNELSKYLKTKREQANIKQIDLARKIGLNNSQYISNVERGLCGPSIDLIKAYGDLCYVDMQKVVNLIIRQKKAKLIDELC